MRQLIHGLVLTLCLLGTASAAIDAYEFKDEAERARYRTLVEELRCPKCQNQNIADSNAPIAMDLRREMSRLSIIWSPATATSCSISPRSTPKHWSSGMGQPPCW